MLPIMKNLVNVGLDIARFFVLFVIRYPVLLYT